MAKYFGRYAEWDDSYDEEIEIDCRGEKTAAIALACLLKQREPKNFDLTSRLTVKVRPSDKGAFITYVVEPEKIERLVARKVK